MGDGVRNQWQEFIEGEIYTDAEAPWRDDPAFALLRQFPGLREGVGGRIAPALTQTIGLVRAVAGVDLARLVQAKRPSLGLCLGFGMNLLEPYDLLTVFELDQVHAYEWIGEHVVEAAQALQALRVEDPFLPTRIRLHHGTISDLSALAEGSIRVIYVGNVFNSEIPMSPATFTGALQEIIRVLAIGGVLISRGSSRLLEADLKRYGRMLLEIPLVTVFQKE
jgi:hypothetical protein